MEHISHILGTGVIISLASLSGFILVKSHTRVARFTEQHLEELSAFSGGIFLISSIMMARHAIHTGGRQNALISFAVGAILFILLHLFIMKSHRHKGDCAEHRKIHSNKRSGWKIILGDTFHNIADGLFLVSSFSVNRVIGFSSALSILLHEIPQEISEFIVLRKVGMGTKEASIKNFVSSFSIFIGITLGFYLIEMTQIQSYFIGISSVFFLGVVFTDLFPVREVVRGKNWKMFLFFATGFLFMLSILLGISYH